MSYIHIGEMNTATVPGAAVNGKAVQVSNSHPHIGLQNCSRKKSSLAVKFSCFFI